ncbi:alpha/beta hydrolase [Puia sp.]|jgi:pimeloyl-ACP methyl ester carboxylesterase|uniref:alpha/beta fold hydrolase n=1 Tax=Puia sp. TaxID=2045100 RepID=UPI002F3E44BF
MVARIGRILLRIVVGLLIFIVILLLVFDRLVQFRMDDKELFSWFHERHLDPRIDYYQAKGRRIRYLAIGDRPDATILFIHGAPSSLSYWKDYLADSLLLSRATMYAVDRPGYGYSGLANAMPDIGDQADVIRLILDSLHRANHPVIVVGVSYGGPIACRLAMDYPELVDGLVLVAPPIGPGLEKIFWFTYPVETPAVHWFVPRMLKTANEEKVHHRAELTKMLPLWGRIHVPVIYVQGEQDGLVDTTNAGFARQHLLNAPSLTIRMIPGRGHLIAFAEKDRIEKAILDMLDTTEAKHGVPARPAGSVATGHP